MDKQKKTTGIVLRRFNLNEADQIITLLTKDEGKVSVLAKGSRRLKSKFCGRLEPFYEVELNYFQGRELGHLNEVELLEAYPLPEADLKVTGILFYIAEITCKLVADDQDAGEAYDLLQNCLRQFEAAQSEVVLHTYMVKLLTLLGFMASWQVCSRTGERIDLKEAYFLSMQDASVIHRRHADSADLRLTPSVIKWVNYMQKEDFALIKRVRPSLGERNEVSFIMQSVFGNLFHYPFKSEAFLRVTF